MQNEQVLAATREAVAQSEFRLADRFLPPGLALQGRYLHKVYTRYIYMTLIT